MNESFIQSLDRLTPHNKAIFTVYNVIWGEERVLFLCIWQFQNKCTWFYSTPAVTFSVAIFTLKKQNMFTNIYCSDSLLACFCVLHVSMTACDVRVCVCVFQSLSPKPVYLWLPSEVAGRLPAGQPHWDKRRPLHQPSTARQQTDRTNQEQEVPLLRYKHAVLWNSVDRLRHIIHKLTHCPVFSFCVFLLGFSLSLSLLTSSPFFAASLSCDHTHTHGVLSFRLFFKLFFTFTLSLSLH